MRVRAALAALLATALAACTAAPTLEPTPTRTAREATPSPSASPNPAGVLPDGWDEATVLETSQASGVTAGSELRVDLTVDSSPVGGVAALAQIPTLLPSGQIVVIEAPVGSDSPAQVALYGPGGDRESLARWPDDGTWRQAPYAEATDERVAVMETASTDLLTLDWRIVSAATDGSTAEVIADWSDWTSEPPPLVGAEVLPSVGDDFVAWNAPLPSDGQGWRGSGFDQQVLVFGADGETRVLEGRAAVHAASGQYLYVAHDPLFDPDVPIGTYAITRVDPTGGGPEEVVAAGPLTSAGRVSDVAADGDAVAWVVSDGSRAAIYLIDGARRVVIHAPDPAGSARMSLSGGRLAWGEGSAGADGGTYLLDRDDTLWRLATSPGRSEASVAGDWVAWAQVAEDGRSSAVQVARWLR